MAFISSASASSSPNNPPRPLPRLRDERPIFLTRLRCHKPTREPCLRSGGRPAPRNSFPCNTRARRTFRRARCPALRQARRPPRRHRRPRSARFKVREHGACADAALHEPRLPCRGRDAGYPAPPAQIPASGFPAPGSSDQLALACASGLPLGRTRFVNLWQKLISCWQGIFRPVFSTIRGRGIS